MKIDLLINASRKAASFLLRDFNELKHFKHSSLKVLDFIRRSEIKVAQTLVDDLQRYFPDHEMIDANQEIPDLDNRCYIMFQAIDSVENIACGQSFFATIIFAVTINKGIVNKLLVMNFPALDRIFYTTTSEDLWIENYQNSLRAKAHISSINDIVAIKNLSPDVLLLLEDKNINLADVRIFGSDAYSLLMLVSGAAGMCLIESKGKNNIINNAAELITQSCGAFSQQLSAANFDEKHPTLTTNNSFILYSGKRNYAKKILSFPKIA